MKYTISDLQQMYRSYRMKALFLLLLLVAALVFVFQNHILTLAALALAVLFHLCVIRPWQKKYANAFTCANLEHTLCLKLNTPSVSEKNAVHITPSLMKKAALMPFHQTSSTPLLRWELSGQIRGLSVSLCDAVLAQDFKLVEKGKQRVHMNTGVWIHIELSKDTGLNFRLLDENSVPTPIRMDFFSKESLYISSPVPDAELAKCFVLYHPAAEDTPVLPNRFLRELKKLKDYTPGYAAVSIHDKQLDIFIRNRFLTRPVSVRQAPTEELLNFDPFPELRYLLDLADAL